MQSLVVMWGIEFAARSPSVHRSSHFTSSVHKNLTDVARAAALGRTDTD